MSNIFKTSSGGGGGGGVETLTGNDSIIVGPTAGNINVVGGAGIDVTGNAATSTLTITATSTAFMWNVVTSTSPTNPIQIVAENGYICDGSSLVTFLLPLGPSIGDTFIIISNTARFQINENGSQQIAIGTSSSTAGSGNATSNSTGDQVQFVYVGGNIFRGFSPQGTISLN
jgi:hypothetical protein